MSELTAACAFDSSTPFELTLLRVLVEVEAPVILLGGLTVETDLTESSTAARPEKDASEDASSVSGRVAMDEGEGGKGGRVMFMLVRLDGGPDAREDADPLPAASRLRSASTVLLPLADRLLP